MAEQRTDNDGVWERTSRYGWALVTPSAAWLAQRTVSVPPPDPDVAAVQALLAKPAPSVTELHQVIRLLAKRQGIA